MTEVTSFTLTKPAVMAFPALDKPRAFKKGGKDVGEAKFGATFVFPLDHPDIASMKQTAVTVARAKWPGRELKTLSFPFSNGNARADLRQQRKPGSTDAEFMRNKLIVAARSKYRPILGLVEGGRIIDVDDGNIAQHIRKFYFGTEAVAVFNFVAFEGIGDKPDGVTAYLQQVLSFNRGERLSQAGAPASQTFRGYVGQVSNEDPTGGADLDDEIPF